MTPSDFQRRVLFITYAFPPVGGAGVQRVTKFVKYLPGFGWTPSILTPSNPSVPVLDSSLSSDIPGDTIVRRARTFEPSYALKNLVSAGSGERSGHRFAALRAAKDAVRHTLIRMLHPDPQVLWYPAGVRAGRRLLKDVRHEAIIVTGPPFSTFLIGAALHRETGLPLVLDYRDEWGLANRFLENKGYGRLAVRFQSVMQRRVVRKASAIVATTASSAGTLTRIRDDAGGTARVLCIHNGFDPDDFARPAPPARRDSRYRIVYAGTLWNLTSVAPLIDAVSALCRQSPEVAARLELVLAGRRTTDQQRTLTRLLETPVHVVEHNYMAHDLVLDLMRSADVLCALLTDAPGAERVLPGKIFEYMACRRPILAIAPPGDLWQVLEDYPAAHRYEPSDVGGITAFLARRLQEFETSATKQAIMWDDPRYNRREQARTLAGLLSDITGSSPGS